MLSNILSFLTFLKILTIVLESILKEDSLKDQFERTFKYLYFSSFKTGTNTKVLNFCFLPSRSYPKPLQ